jgi:hypothetical protein
MRLLLLVLLTSLSACSNMGSVSTNSHSTARTASAAPAVNVAVTFSPDEARIIRDYYQSVMVDKKGKGKSKSLPPGIAKNLRRGKPLPPGIAKRALPYDLRIKLPDLPAGHDRFIVAGKILLVELGTQIVRDILTDVAFG